MLLWTGILLLALSSLLVVGLPLWRSGNRAGAGLAVTVMLAIALGGYLSIGNPGLVSETAKQRPQDAPRDMETLVQQLAKRLESEPDDIEGWTMLGRANVMMGRFDKAADAYREVIDRSANPGPGATLNYVEALVLSDMNALQGEAGVLLEGILDKKPDDPRALWYGGLAAEANGDTALAVERWQRLLQQDLPDSFRQIAEERVLRIAPDALDVELTVTVSISPDIREVVPREGTLFVSLRRPDAAAGTPPLAARRMASFRYPVDVRFRAADVFSGDSLPDEPLDVLVRVTASDDALRTEGGVQGSSRWDGESASVSVTIDRQTQ